MNLISISCRVAALTVASILMASSVTAEPISAEQYKEFFHPPVPAASPTAAPVGTPAAPKPAPLPLECLQPEHDPAACRVAVDSDTRQICFGSCVGSGTVFHVKATPPKKQYLIHHASPAVQGGAAPCITVSKDDYSGNLCVTFALRSAVLTKEDEQNLINFIAGALSQDINDTMVIEGYTDSRGDETKNLNLSNARAQAVVDFLTAHGVSATRLKAQGYGASHFLPERLPTDGANRRVEAHWASATSTS